jgi:hypothetical protein
LPNLPIQPFSTAQDVLTAAIVFANDQGGPAGISGNILNPSTNPGVMPALFERYRYLCQRLVSAGVDTYVRDAVVYGLCKSATNDPKARMFLSVNGYFDGQVWRGPDISAPAWSDSVTYTQGMTVQYSGSYYVAQPNSADNINQEPDSSPTFWAQFSVIGPALPADLIKPLEIWEAQSGSNEPWRLMTQAPDSVTVTVIQPRFGQWSFANERLILPPASFDNNLRMKYICQPPDITSLKTIIYPRNCVTALALLVLDQLAGGRGGPMADVFKARAEEAIGQLINPTVRKQAYASFVRQPFRGGRGAGRGRR